MLSESVAGGRQARGGQLFWWRLTDNLFRRLGWFVLPILAMTLLGYQQASQTPQVFHATGTLSAATNPLLPNQEISGVSKNWWESPAAAMSRSINEQLLTDTFLGEIAREAGLGEALDAGLLDLGVVRSNIWAYGKGDSLLAVSAQWGDPKISFELANATIATYQNFLTETATSASDNAETYYDSQLTDLRRQRDRAQTALADFVAELPPISVGETYPADQQVRLDDLKNQVESIDDKIDATQAKIDEAQLARLQQTSEAGRSVTVIDRPKVPTAPDSTLMNRVTLIAGFLMLGLVIAAAAVLVTTVLDHSVASANDLLALDGIRLVATVPPVRIGTAEQRTLTRRRGRDQLVEKGAA